MDNEEIIIPTFEVDNSGSLKEMTPEQRQAEVDRQNKLLKMYGTRLIEKEAAYIRKLLGIDN